MKVLEFIRKFSKESFNPENSFIYFKFSKLKGKLQSVSNDIGFYLDYLYPSCLTIPKLGFIAPLQYSP